MDYKILNTIKSPQDLKQRSDVELLLLCKELRDILVSTISKTGGHIASNLGVVELTVAIHRIFDCPNDKIVWDVGHQSYVHKILTERLSSFQTIRQKDGLGGFPRQSESKYDGFIGGHSSVSISAAYGIAKVNTLENRNQYTIAVIGDGSLTGGLAYEGLNNAGKDKKEKLIVILNDNKMSISKNVGGMAKYLSKIRNASSYFKAKDTIKWGLHKFPFIGDKISNTITKSKLMLKDTLYHSNFFENLGFEYLGPVDGHDINSLSQVLVRAKQLEKPVFVHVITTKGKGHKLAERNPSKYHGVSRSSTNDNCISRSDAAGTDFSSIFGDELINLASKNKKVVAITAAMCQGTGLSIYKNKIPDRFFDVGIAEQHAVTFAAGMASNGYIPVLAIYSTFLQRAFDQIIHDAAIENQHLVLAVDRAGVVGEDGETHQGIFDVSYLSCIPNVTIYSPSSYAELRKYLKVAVNKEKGIVAVRYPRGAQPIIIDKYNFDKDSEYHFYHNNGCRSLVITYGRLISVVCELRDHLKDNNIDVSILKLDKIWPIEEEIVKLVLQFNEILFVEESVKSGGIAEHLGIMLMEHSYNGRYKIKAIDNKFVPQASMAESLDDLGFTAEKLEKFFITD